MNESCLHQPSRSVRGNSVALAHDLAWWLRDFNRSVRIDGRNEQDDYAFENAAIPARRRHAAESSNAADGRRRIEDPKRISGRARSSGGGGPESLTARDGAPRLSSI